ncbi:MAG: RagB/SusD family nutrient uptake outer membrane protein [Bacteroidaceae bacterium]|nr:RagB/SusD family nutrient uptake outer membrane protein [Bacteroidaceae bacterium]
MKSFIKYILPAAAVVAGLGLASCVNDLDVEPIDPNLNTQLDANGLFNKCYANLGIAGNSSGDENCDIENLNGGMSGFIRQMWNANELTTDEAICWWGDDGIPEYDYNTYGPEHPMLRGLYYRIYFGISICNQYLAECSDIDATKTAEVRFLRALYYYYLLDMWGNVSFTTKVGDPGTQLPRAELYAWLEQELKEIEPSMATPKAKKSTDDGYGRADQAAAWMLLARLYLNAEVYTGEAQWTLASQYAKKVMTESGRSLNTTGQNGWTAYQMLFMGDNGESSAAQEAILPILQDGITTQSYTVTYFLMSSCFSDDMHPWFDDKTCGAGSWSGNRARPEFLEVFFPGRSIPQDADTRTIRTAAGDERAMFWTIKQSLDITENTAFKYGTAVTKYNTFYSSAADGSGQHDAGFPDTDFFLMRLAEAYLTYAEAEARLNNGNATGAAAKAINDLRSRANNTVQASAYDLQDILDEWAREFYFEGRRRTDLIRFGKFGGTNVDYVWQWKGGVYAGRNFSADRNLFAIPGDDVTASNGAITQNKGY